MSSKIHRISNVLYVPWGYGQRKRGVERGSAKIKQYINELSKSPSFGHEPVHKVIAVLDDDNEKFHEELFRARHELDPNTTLVVGGDHSIAIGSLLGSLDAVKDLNADNETDHKLGVVWIDAHADINTMKMSDSGNTHGMPLAFCTGIDETWNWVNQTKLRLPFEDLYYWGIRDLDNFEIDVIDRHGIQVCRDKQAVMEVFDKYEYIHTSLDIDGIDPKYTPSTGTPADNGLELRDVLDYIYYLKFTNKCIGFDIVEYNPDIGTHLEQQVTEQSVKALLNAIL